MPKVNLVTFHTPKNYGAVLQAFSLASYLRQTGADVSVVDFNTPHLRSLYPIIPKPIGWKSRIKFCQRLPFYAATYSAKKRKFRKFDDFVRQNLPLTKRYESIEALYAEDWENCVFVTGSDQVFNPGRIAEERRAFYLDFTPENAKRVAYAASFGVQNIPDDKKSEIQCYLKRFDSLAVREKSGQAIVKELVDRDAEKVLDPVFLNDADFWKKHAAPYPVSEGKYLFYYRLMGGAAGDRHAARIAKERNLRLVVMTDAPLLRSKADLVVRDVGPQEFLALTAGADFVVTDSFHGVAFSLILRKQFLFCDENPRLNDRGLDLLNITKLREIAYCPNYRNGATIDYAAVEPLLAAEIARSKEYLDRAIGE